MSMLTSISGLVFNPGLELWLLRCQ
jgi:hypothetical protein